MARKKPKINAPRRRRTTAAETQNPWLLISVVAGVSLLALGALGFWLYHYADFKFLDKTSSKIITASANAGMKVDDIYIVGRQDLSHAQLLSKIDVKRGTPLLAVNTQDIQSRIMELPPVHMATVRRLWPNRLLVTVQERVPIALWQKKQILFPIDKDGVTLTYQRAENFANLPVIVGDEAPKLTHELLTALDAYPELKSQLKAATYISGRRWDLHLKSGMLIKLPDGDIGAGLKRLMQ
ncbi:MAG TPA: FtsQ-type POTRA domain-containing protein, partial [Alphaproteobacteria bacterium]|nr:FtsQ-type POTRA domain-containing protein [Alphaproteobacteria bacterium]